MYKTIEILLISGFKVYSGWRNYYTHFVFVGRINTPNIDNTDITMFS